MPIPRCAAAALTLVLLAGCSAGADRSPRAASSTPASVAASAPQDAPAGASPATPDGSATPTPASWQPTRELPRGGTTVFPAYRLAGYCGYPGAPGQGRAGIGDLDERLVEMEQRMAPYAGDRKVQPVLELIAVTVHAVPGPHGTYNTRTDEAIVDEWLAAARRHRAILLLNIQPGTADFLTEVKAFEKYLTQPDVGVALDPEWAIQPGQVPGTVFGRTTGQDLDRVAAYLSGLVTAHGLPEKVMVYHQLHPGVVVDEAAMVPHPGVAVVKSADGIGAQWAKEFSWRQLVPTTPSFVRPGFKLFYEEDVQVGGQLMTPEAVLALQPTPDYVLYE